ncbi:MAG TPA: prepilin-type N-terminal cleavage/methylation domain-containing protein [Longimicrobiales bacterium]
MRPTRREGFTLVELMIVVVVIGILASIAIVGYQSVRRRAAVSSMQSDLRNLVVKQEMYHTEQHSYSLDPAALQQSETPGVNLTINNATNSGWGAVVTHDAYPGLECGIFIGTATAADAGPATIAEQVACNE